jgi:hypothetical protein
MRRLWVIARVEASALALAPKARFVLAQSASVYRNPILGGDHPDASPIRLGDDFCLTHSSFDCAPGLLIWHSRDPVDWHSVAAALRRYHANGYIFPGRRQTGANAPPSTGPRSTRRPSETTRCLCLLYRGR